MQVEGWPGHLAGQHVDVRLTAEDGYSTQRSYSIASAQNADMLELTIQLLPDGEASSYLVQDFKIGDPILSLGLVKIGDPIYLPKWETADPAPTLLQVQSLADIAVFEKDSPAGGGIVGSSSSGSLGRCQF